MSNAPANGSKASAVNPTELAKPKATPVGELGTFMAKMKQQFAMALPKHLNVERMQRLAMTEFSKSKDLQQCSMMSIAAAVMTASQLGLEIGVAGQAYLIPYKTGRGNYIATLVPGWKGLIDLVNRAGRSSAWTGAVFEGDEFEWCLGDRPYITHRPKGDPDPTRMLYAYAVGRVNGSDWPVIECWTNERIKKHRDKHNKVGAKHYSFNNWEMYARKVVLLQVLKYLPTSIELTAAMDLTYNEEDGKSLVLDANFVTIETNEAGEAVDGETTTAEGETK